MKKSTSSHSKVLGLCGNRDDAGVYLSDLNVQSAFKKCIADKFYLVFLPKPHTIKQLFTNTYTKSDYYNFPFTEWELFIIAICCMHSNKLYLLYPQPVSFWSCGSEKLYKINFFVHTMCSVHT